MITPTAGRQSQVSVPEARGVATTQACDHAILPLRAGEAQ
jgi:hypothetical protein